jgi:N-acetylneuraminate synthase
MNSKFKLLGHDAPIFIAEIGVNHNGSIDLAKKLIVAAKEANAHFVKFQSFRTEHLVHTSAPLAPYQRKNNRRKTQLEMLRNLELSENQQLELFDYAKQIEIDFLTTPFDPTSLDFLISKMNLPVIKIGSGDLTDVRLLYRLGASKRHILLSTGMSKVNEIWTALYAIYIGHKGLNPSNIGDVSKAVRDEVKDWLMKSIPSVTLLHCTSSYPAPKEDLNLGAIQTLREEFGVAIGYSDHSLGINAALHAITLGAVLIEKHITLSKEFEGPDHKASASPEEFAQMVEQSKEINIMLGEKAKLISSSEAANLIFARKGLYAKKRISKGTIFSEENLLVLRPQAGLSAAHYYEVLGTTSTREYESGEAIVFNG